MKEVGTKKKVTKTPFKAEACRERRGDLCDGMSLPAESSDFRSFEL